MSNIEQYLADILAARYGEEVRQSIHDAIQQCYEDGRAGAIDLEARTLLGDTDISGISETVTGAVVELNGAVETAQETADGAQTTAEAKLSPADAWKIEKTSGTVELTVAAGGTVRLSIPNSKGLSAYILSVRSADKTRTLVPLNMMEDETIFTVIFYNVGSSAYSSETMTLEVTYAYT